jgi:hypothetical protein
MLPSMNIVIARQAPDAIEQQAAFPLYTSTECSHAS